MSPTYGPRTTLARVLRLCTPVIPSTRHDSRFLARVTTLHDPFALHTLSLSLSPGCRSICDQKRPPLICLSRGDDRGIPYLDWIWVFSIVSVVVFVVFQFQYDLFSFSLRILTTLIILSIIRFRLLLRLLLFILGTND